MLFCLNYHIDDIPDFDEHYDEHYNEHHEADVTIVL